MFDPELFVIQESEKFAKENKKEADKLMKDLKEKYPNARVPIVYSVCGMATITGFTPDDLRFSADFLDSDVHKKFLKHQEVVNQTIDAQADVLKEKIKES